MKNQMIIATLAYIDTNKTFLKLTNKINKLEEENRSTLPNIQEEDQ
jgi:hypothetical protein